MFSCLLRWFWLMRYRFRLVALSFVVGVWMYGRGLPGDSLGVLWIGDCCFASYLWNCVSWLGLVGLGRYLRGL